MAEIPEHVVAGFFDKAKERLILLKDDMVLNQLRREGPKIAESFDRAFDSELKEISAEFAKTFGLLWLGTQRTLAKKDEVRSQGCVLLLNSGQTIVGALELVRHGFRLQPGMLIRNAIEMICVALSLFTNQTAVEDYRVGTLNSPKAVTHAKKIIPILGKLYGFFSRQFAHLGDLQQQLHSWDAFDPSDEAADMNLRFITMAINLLTVSTELILFDCAEEHRYWKRAEGNKYVYIPSEEEKTWQAKFLRM
jgi:hypothetical protein